MNIHSGQIWGITDDAGYLRYGGGIDRAKDVLWEMNNEDPIWKGKKLRLVLIENMEEFNKPFPWFPPTEASVKQNY